MQRREAVQDFDSWRQLVSAAFVPLEVQGGGRSGAGFAGAVGVSGDRSIEMATVSAGPHAVLRTPELIRSGEAGRFKLSLQLSGTGLLVQDGREILLSPGSLALYDTTTPYTLSFDSDFSCHVLMLPHSGLGVAPELARQLTATQLEGEHHLGPAVSAFLRQAMDLAPDLPTSMECRLGRNAVDLLGTLVADVLGVGAAEAPAQPTAHSQAARAEQRAAILEHIEQHLADPQLSPASIAAAHFISVRALHLLFEGTGETVAALIRQRRLARCREELIDPRNRDRPVAVIGARWGFADPAHFSRVFRAHYGAAPGQLRRTGG